MRIGIRAPLVLVVGALVGATVAVAAIPSLAFAYLSADAHLVLETTAWLIAFLAAFILYGRLRESRQVSELVLFIALLLLGIANLTRAVAPSFDGSNPRVVWVPLVVQLLGAAALAAAPFVRPRTVRERRRGLAYTGAAVLAAAILVGVVAIAAGELATGINPSLSPRDARETGHLAAPGFLVLQAVSMILYGVAAFGFARRAGRGGDELLAWLALAASLAAVSRLNYFLFPSVYSDWVFTGDVLRLAAYVAILAGALRQIAVYQEAAPRAAILEERQRIALDLHDRLAQDLAYISLRARRLAGEQDGGASLAAAARDALIQSRAMIVNLRTSEVPLGEAVARLATALGERYELDLELEIDDGLDARDEERHELLGIVSEAISNAARHGGARTIRIRLSRDWARGLTLEVTDDGRGFDPSTVTRRSSDGFGIVGMRERVERLGGRLELRSEPGAGAVVRVLLE